VPLGASLVLVTLALGLLYAYAGDVHLLLSGWMPTLAADAWYEWIWVGPGRALFALVGYVLFLFAVALSVVAASLLANVVSAPFLDALSQRVERIESGTLAQAGEGGEGAFRAVAGEVRRTVLGELQRVAFLASGWALISLFGIVVPGAQLVAPWLLVGLTILFLPLDYAGHLLDRRRLPFRTRRAWLRANLSPVTGFGVAAFLVCMVPGLNLVLLPALITAGTLLALRNPPAAQ